MNDEQNARPKFEVGPELKEAELIGKYALQVKMEGIAGFMPGNTEQVKRDLKSVYERMKRLKERLLQSSERSVAVTFDEQNIVPQIVELAKEMGNEVDGPEGLRWDLSYEEVSHAYSYTFLLSRT